MEQFQELIIAVFSVSILAAIVLNIASLIGASWYDWRKLTAKAGKRRYRPLVSVIIPAHNEEAGIARCLDSLLAGSYRKLEIIVVDDASTDSTKTVVRRVIAANPKRIVRLLVSPHNVGRGAAINAGFARYAKGDLIMAMDADCVVDKQAVTNAVRHFANGQIVALAANVRIMEQPRLLGLLQQFEYLVGFRAKKFYTLANCEYIVGGAGAVYSRPIFSQLGGFDETMKTEDIALSLTIAKLGNRKHRLAYADDVLIYTEPVPNLRSLLAQRYRWKFGSLQAIFAHRSLVMSRQQQHTWTLSWMRLPMALWSELLLALEPLFFTYFLLAALAYRNPTLFLSAWAVMTGLLLLTVWGDEYLPNKTKAKLTAATPIMYGVYYIMTAVQVVAVIQCIINAKAVVGRRTTRGTWVSPERIG